MIQSVPLPAGVLVFFLFLLSYVRNYFRKGLRSLPGPILARFSGLYRLSLVHDGHAPERYRELHEEYGPIVRTGPNHVSVSDAAMIPTIYGIGSKFLKTPFYTTMAPFYKDLKMDSLFTTRDPAYHSALKKPVAQLFSMTNMKHFEPNTDECTAIFLDSMRDLQGQPVDLAIWLQWYAFDVIGNITFQRKFGFMKERRDVDDMIRGIDEALKYVKVIGQFPAWHGLLIGNKVFRKTLPKILPVPDTMQKFIKITEDEIARYDQEEKDTARTDFLAQIRSKQSKDGSISQRDAMNHLSNNLLAGSDTTAISLRACFYYLIKTPRVYQKLVAEVEEADRNGALSTFITYDECLKLTYLQAVIKEALRMHPGVGFPLERYVPAGGAVICGTHLPAGTNISMSAPTIHYDKSTFGSDAFEFRPERWLEATPQQLKDMDRGFLAFGYGARTCIGKNISIMEMGKFVPQVFRHFDIEWASEKPEWETYAAWFWKQSEIIVRFSAKQK